MLKQGYTELTLEILQKSPEVGHLLVQLHDKHKLYALAKSDQPESRTELAAIMADLLEIKLSPAESELITDVLMSLMRQAEENLKRAVAERLSTIKGVPLRLIIHLANEKISIARPVLERSRTLNDNDLAYIVQSQSKLHWQSIAKRAKISKELIDMLADKKDLKTAINLTENKNIILTGNAMTIFSDMAEGSEELAKPLLMREELSAKFAAKLYDFVSYELKAHIRNNFDIGDDLLDEAVDDIVFEMSDVNAKYSPKPNMVEAAENMLERGFLNPYVMVENLRRGQISNYIAMFSVYCGLPVSTVVDMVHKKEAQGLAVACKAMGIQKSEFINMFLLTAVIRGGAVIQQSELAKALAYYDRVQKKVAKRILDQSRH